MTPFRFLLCLAVLRSFLLSSSAADWQPDPALGNVAQHQRLYQIGRAYADTNFDPAANLVSTPSAKFPVPPNPRRHSYRESATYALGLLMTGDPADRARAEKILPLVLATQDTRPGSPSRGAFLWYTDQTWQMPNPDLNSAEFVGLTLASIIDLDNRRHVLDPGLRRQVDAACRLAVEQAIQRNVDANYTNIALLSSALAAAGAKFWQMPEAERFAQSKLDTVLCLARDGVCYEYLSPTYTAVDLSGAYLARQFAFSDAFAATARSMIDDLWRQVAASYDADTFQLAGPFGRSYGNDMLTYAAGLKYFIYLALDGKYPIGDVDPQHGADQCGLMLLAALPVGPRPEFQAPVPAWREFSAVGGGQWPERHLAQYRAPDFVLGTVAFQDEWLQKRNLVAFWRTDVASAPGYRIGFCIDQSNETLPAGFPYARIQFFSRQEKDAALVSLVAGDVVPPKGSCSLVFDEAAVPTAAEISKPFVIRDGAFTTSLYPVTTGNAGFQAQADPAHHVLWVSRDWSTADVVGSQHILSYLVVFRGPGQPAPEVSRLALQAGPAGVTAEAIVDGHDLKVRFAD